MVREADHPSMGQARGLMRDGRVERAIGWWGGGGGAVSAPIMLEGPAVAGKLSEAADARWCDHRALLVDVVDPRSEGERSALRALDDDVPDLWPRVSIRGAHDHALALEHRGHLMDRRRTALA